MKRTLAACAVLLLLSAMVGCRTTQLHSPIMSNVPVQLNEQQIQKSIMKGCIEAGWTPRLVADNTIEASILVRGKHTVVVSIPYSHTGYQINYKDSTNMEYKMAGKDGMPAIHPNYNKWVARLRQIIDRNLSVSTL